MPQSAPTRRYDAVICDIDGCLSPESAAPMDLAALERIARHNRLAAAQGDRPLLTLCSGRQQPFVEAMCKATANESLACVAENGVWLFDPATNRNEMDPTITPAHLEAVRELVAWVAATFGGRGVGQQPGKSASTSLYHPEPEVLRRIMPEIEARCRAEGWPIRVTMTWFYINCDLEHITKATGGRRLLERAGLDPARVAGIGDTGSDQGIRDCVAFFGAPANAMPAAKEMADYVARTEEAAGVLEILGQLGPQA